MGLWKECAHAMDGNQKQRKSLKEKGNKNYTHTANQKSSAAISQIAICVFVLVLSLEVLENSAFTDYFEGKWTAEDYSSGDHMRIDRAEWVR